MRQLIVNADDFGFTADVNEGIIEAHRNGIVTSATIMAVGQAFHQAQLLAKDNPALGVGVHLVLVGARALSRPGRALPETVRGLLFDSSLDVEREMDVQINRVLDTGLQPTHLDAHKHAHALPKVARAIGRLARRYGIRWVRRPLPWLGGIARRSLAAEGSKMTDHFIGFRQTGSLDTTTLIQLIKNLPDGLTELMVHPGYCRTELNAARTRLKQSRQVELEALVSPAVKQAIQDRGVELISYGNLAKGPLAAHHSA